MEHLETKIIDFLVRHNLTEKQKVLIIGFSGGYDSLCLLDVLQKNSKTYNFKPIAVHLNHAWRGEESNIEEENARQYCQKHGIEFYSEKLSSDLPHTELEARNQRYSFFNRAAKKYKADGILTGHTLTDQVETVLYRIIKGTGINGLQGIPEVRLQKEACPIFRPMLDLKREDTVKYCENNNLTVNLDSSNLNLHYLRNKIRLNLIPELKQYNFQIVEALIRLSEIAKDSENIIDEYISSIEKRIYVKNQEIDTAKFLDLSDALKKKIIINFLTKQDIQYDYKKVNEIIDFINFNFTSKSGKTLSLTESSWLFVSFTQIKLIHSIKANMVKSVKEVNVGSLTELKEFEKTVEIQEWQGGKPDKFPNETADYAYVDLTQIDSPLCFRTRRDGDIIRPFGMNHKMKLKKYLINKGIPQHKRDELLMLTVDNEVLWIVGIGISNKLKVKDVPTHIIRIKGNGNE